MQELQKEFVLTYIFISHGLPVVALVADRIAAMHGGRFAELATAEKILKSPQHEYTRQLLAAVPEVTAGALLAAVLLVKYFLASFVISG